MVVGCAAVPEPAIRPNETNGSKYLICVSNVKYLLEV